MRDKREVGVHICIFVFGEGQLKFISSVIVAGRTRTWVLGYWHVIMISYFRLDECWRFRWDMRYAMHTSDYSWDDLRVDAWGRRQVPTLPTLPNLLPSHTSFIMTVIIDYAPTYSSLFLSSLSSFLHNFPHSSLRLERRFFLFLSFFLVLFFLFPSRRFSYWQVALYPLPKLRWITLWGKYEECCRWWGCLERSVANFQKGSSLSFSRFFLFSPFWNTSNAFYILDIRRVPMG